MYLTQPIHRRVQCQPDAPFTICDGRATTNAEAIDHVARMAGGLRALGARRDARVGILDLTTDWFCQAALAVAWADGVLVPVNYRWSAKEIAYSLEESSVEVLLVGDAFLGLALQLRDAVPGLRSVVHLGEGAPREPLVPLSELMSAAPVPDAERGGDDVLGIYYTGGTTGLPKGVMLTHRGAMISALGSIASGRFPSGGSALLVAPVFHMAGFAGWIISLLLDQAAVPVAEFTPTAVMQLIEQYAVKQTTLVPTMIQMVVDHPEFEKFDLSSLEVLLYGASPISESLLERTRKAFPSAELCQAYGMTELSPAVTHLSNADHADPVRRRSAGRALPYGLVKIVDADDNEVPRGTVGEIVARGEHVMLGYWNKPDETAAALRGGWMHTGDGGYMDEDGYVYVVDRLKDMIISGGENVYSVEVEKAVARHPSVAQCAVIGLPDDSWGERVHVLVELVPGSSLTLSELREFCRADIAGYKIPRSLEVIDSWPLSAAGKVLKRELRAQRR